MNRESWQILLQNTRLIVVCSAAAARTELRGPNINISFYPHKLMRL
jgi:hypothetical protein